MSHPFDQETPSGRSSEVNEQSAVSPRHESRVHVALCADLGFVVPLAATMASLASTMGSNLLTVHVVHQGFDDRTKGKLLAGAGDLQVRWHEIDEVAVRGLNNTSFLSDGALYRLMLGEVLPPDLPRVIYLDTDIVVVGRLAELFEQDLGGRPIGAVRDAVSPWAAGVYGADWEELGMEPSSPYFNSGVLLIDLNAWRAERSGEKCVELLRRLAPRWGDQDALNKVFENRWCELPLRWNVQTADVLRRSFSWALRRPEVEGAVAEPGIVHYTTRDKPWMPGSEHPEEGRWFAALDRTAWRGWRPRAPVHQHRGLLAPVAGAMRAFRARRLKQRERLPH